MAEPTPEPTPSPSPAPTQAPTPAPLSLAERQLQATIALVLAQERLATVAQGQVAALQQIGAAVSDPSWLLSQVATGLMPVALKKLDTVEGGAAAALAVTWAVALVNEVRGRDLEGMFIS